jgi:hypothetical protein
MSGSTLVSAMMETVCMVRRTVVTVAMMQPKLVTLHQYVALRVSPVVVEVSATQA